ncbi:OLC1v1011489C1 [Oldenlandia corymbosa var. corymbosa]|uniref:peroxidase n=1 Tax=Oldenlandia corymbosa var. corymbosa TaxID=529605 RepID=A0AAV1DWY5_OLDCO|nr:OLC1v1011489C1 [Oldenlandia corymbosa var. corymbosa]
MIALSACHTVGFSHCGRFQNRIFNFSRTNPVDPSMNKQYADQLRTSCPIGVDPTIVVFMDPTTPRTFDNAYFKNLQQGKGLFTSDEVLFTDGRSKASVNTFAGNPQAFNQAFVTAITKLARTGVKTSPRNGNIRRVCGAFN